jgi:two-component system nitrogen regulation sensor histidine kinase NtrY
MFPIILIILIISLFFNREILDPIENLSRATRRIAEGDLKFQVESSYSDEFNLLSRSFNSMINELEMSRDKLQFKQKILTWKEIGEQFAHELKNPLTPIRLQTDRILRKIENKAENLEEVILNGLKIIRIESEKMESILNEFTGLSQYQSFNRMSLDLNDMMSEVVETMTRSYDRLSISFIPFKQHILMISVDPQQFKKVLMNLFENSCERMKRTGSIRFEISEKVTDLRKYAVITMSDQCTEGSDVRNENDFSPYLHQEGHSKLLYLIIQKIVNEHDGRFYYEMSHSGTDYRIELPVAEMEAK